MMSPPDASGTPGGLTRRQVRERTTRALATRALVSSERRRQELLEYAVDLNMGIARAIVSGYAKAGIETEELLSVAHAALTRAARDFEPGRYDEFLSCAVRTVRSDLGKHFYDRRGAPPSPTGQETDCLSGSW